MSLLVVKGGLVVTDDGQDVVGDVVISGENVVMVTSDPIVCSWFESLAGLAGVIDAAGKVVVPGGIDPHCHLEYPQGGNTIVSADDFNTGSVAAACGGTTTVIDFVEAQKGETLPQALAARRAAAEARSVVDFSFHMSLNRADERTLGPEVREVVSEGVSSFKIYTAYDGIRLKDDGEIVAVFKSLRGCGGLPIVHAENHELIMSRLREAREAHAHDPSGHPATRPVQGEAEATHRVSMLAEAVGVPAGLHVVHVTAEVALPTFRLAAARTLANGTGRITGEVCAHHLFLTDDVYRRPRGESADFVCAPPLRPSSDVDAMWRALADKTLSFVVTDHCE